MALFRAEHPEQCGIATLDESNKIVSFVEKRTRQRAIWRMPESILPDRQCLIFFRSQAFLISGRMFSKMVGRMTGGTKDYLLDIGTPENYKKAQWEWKT
jgi:mannose-1-phosphate guanylyltransferase